MGGIVRKSLKSVKRVRIDVHSADPEDDVKLVSVVLKPPNRLECVIKTPISRLGEICAALERGIFHLVNTTKEVLLLKLLIVCDTYASQSTSEIMFQISGVINRLYESEVKDYLVSCKFSGYRGLS